MSRTCCSSWACCVALLSWWIRRFRHQLDPEWIDSLLQRAREISVAMSSAVIGPSKRCWKRPSGSITYRSINACFGSIWICSCGWKPRFSRGFAGTPRNSGRQEFDRVGDRDLGDPGLAELEAFDLQHQLAFQRRVVEFAGQYFDPGNLAAGRDRQFNDDLAR